MKRTKKSTSWKKIVIGFLTLVLVGLFFTVIYGDDEFVIPSNDGEDIHTNIDDKTLQQLIDEDYFATQHGFGCDDTLVISGYEEDGTVICERVPT